MLTIESCVESAGWPDEERLVALAEAACHATIDELAIALPDQAELSLLFTDDARMRLLNLEWRGKDAPTNVLSFEASVEADALEPLLGDIVLAFETIAREAEAQEKSFDAHLTHLIIHGFLHLLGYDHETDDEAETMETAERRILARLGIADPYDAT